MTTPDDDTLRRLEARVERERRAREEAEAIAERSLRHLYQQQERLHMLQRITAAANEAETPDDALRVALAAVCELTDWPIGHVYRVTADRLLPTDFWHFHGGTPERFERFRVLTEQTEFARGEGLPGRVLAAARPAWIADVSGDADFPRVRDDLGVRSAFAFPVCVEREVVAVLEFFSARAEEPDDNLLDTMAVVGEQLGQSVERRRAEAALERTTAALQRSNADLEHFASVASHDLQEPLRMVSSFLQLLQRRYEGELDETADEYIGYAVDGASRMRVLIQNLLAYSRVGTQAKPFEPVDTGGVVKEVTEDLAIAIEEHDADVLIGDLPTVRADPTQLRQVFQNLIGNAVKFSGEAPPEVRIAAERTEAARTDGSAEPGWQFAVSDNGIGIAEEHAERIFQIFQRLHTRDEYEGTGIGLAMCKKIVERHGGRIWLESEPGDGATFYFTLPDNPSFLRDRVDA